MYKTNILNVLGQFMPIAVKSIHRKRMPVSEVRSGQTASFALKRIKRSQIRKGMVMVSPKLNPVACWEFSADIMGLHHPTTIATRYQAMVHCGPIRQTASIIRYIINYVIHGIFFKNNNLLMKI